MQGVFSATKFYKAQKMLNETIEMNKKKNNVFLVGILQEFSKRTKF